MTQAAGQITITDTGAVITTAAACTGGGTNTVVCTDAAITQIGATLGDGGDRIENSTALGSDFNGGDGGGTLIGSTAADWTIDGGTGDDTIDGREGDDRRTFGLIGGLGADSVVGGPGNDSLRGGALLDMPGDDRFQIIRFPFPPEQGDDTMDGGSGFDFVEVQDFTSLFSGGLEPNSPVNLTLAERTLAPRSVRHRFRLRISRRLRAAPGRRATITLHVQATDAAGNRSTRTRTIRLRRS